MKARFFSVPLKSARWIFWSTFRLGVKSSIQSNNEPIISSFESSSMEVVPPDRDVEDNGDELESYGWVRGSDEEGVFWAESWLSSISSTLAGSCILACILIGETSIISDQEDLNQLTIWTSKIFSNHVIRGLFVLERQHERVTAFGFQLVILQTTACKKSFCGAWRSESRSPSLQQNDLEWSEKKCSRGALWHTQSNRASKPSFPWVQTDQGLDR